MAIAGFVLSLLISAQRVEHGNAGDHEAAQYGVEIAATEFIGMFRNLARFIAMVTVVEISRVEDG